MLGVSTAIIAALAWTLYRRRRDVGIVAGTVAMYYWSLLGGWSVVIDKTGGFSGNHRKRAGHVSGNIYSSNKYT